MSTCSISYNPVVIGKRFDGNNYAQLASFFLQSNGEGYFYDVEEASNKIQSFLQERGGDNPPFSVKRFISAVNYASRRNSTSSKASEYFSKDLTELYKNSTESLSYMTNSLEQKLIKLAFVDPDKRSISIDNSSLNANINEYKNDLFKQVFDFVKNNKSESYTNVEFTPLYSGKRFNPTSNFSKVLSDAEEIFKFMNYSTNVSIHNLDAVALLDVYNAAVILSNFDSLVEDKFRNIISVNQTNFSNLNNPLSAFQYFLEFKGLSTEYWSDSGHSDDSAEKYSSNLIKVLSTTIPMLDIDGKQKPNQYLGMNGIYLIGTLVKKLNNSEAIANFQDSPKNSLKMFLESLRKEGDLKYKSYIDSLYNYLYHPRKGVVPLITNAINSNPNLISQVVDIESIIAHQINNVVAPTYGIQSVDGDKRLINLVERDLQGDEIKASIIDHIIQNRHLYNDLEVTSNDVIIKSPIKDISLNSISSNPSKHEIKILKDLTGLSITPNFIKILLNTQAGLANPETVLSNSFKELLKAGNLLIKDLSTIKDISLLGKYLNNTNIVDLVTASISDITPDANMTFKNTVGDSVPTVKLSNLAHEEKTVRELAKKEYGAFANNLLFVKYPNLSKGIETNLEVETDDEESLNALQLNPEEHFFSEFVNNYVKPMSKSQEEIEQTGNYLSFMLVNYSDKSTILNQMIDQYVNLEEKGNLKEIKLEDLKNLHKSYLNTYYSKLIDKISKSYANLIDENGANILEGLMKDSIEVRVQRINDFLTTVGKKGLSKAIKRSFQYAEAQKKLGNLDKDFILEFTDEVHYSSYSDGPRFNKTILNYYQGSLEKPKGEFSDITYLSEILFINKLIETSPNIRPRELFGVRDGDLKIKVARDFYTNLSLDASDWVGSENGVVTNFVYFKYKDNSGNTARITSLNEGLKHVVMKDVELNPLLAKWLHTQNLVRYSSLALTTKHEYQHPHKIKKDYNSMTAVEEMTGRSISMTKRMVIHPATMEYYQQGLRNGVPDKIKLACVNDISAISYNFTGDKQGHDAWDGSLASNPFLTYFLKKSFPAKGISDVQKAIGTCSKDSHSVFLKCALFSFTNEMIRKSSGSSVDLDRIMYSMNNIDIESEIDLSKNSFNGNSIDLNQIVPDGVYFKLGKYTYKVNKLTKNIDGTYSIETTNQETLEPYSFTKNINNLYDLWQVFGGAYSMTKKHNKYVHSDTSVEAVGGIMSVVDSLKDKMIGILAQKSSVKNGATNINEASVLTEPDPYLMYSEFDTHFFGIQLDANHVSDQSVVNEISQVISALAENQATPELYSELYQAIGEIINNEIKEYDKKYKTETGEFNLEKISKDFIDVLKSGDKIGNALEIVDLLEQISEKTIPVSNNNFYKQFAINVISKLKTDFIKRKYPGIAAVLNPSYGMIQIYENEEGITYFHDDLLNMVEDSDYEEGSELLNISTVNKLLVSKVLNRMFGNKPISVSDIKPLDQLIIEGELEPVYLKDISSYYEWKNKLKDFKGEILKVYNKPRDLKPAEIEFVQNGVKKNIFDNDPIRLTWSYDNILKSGDTTSSDYLILTKLAEHFAEKEGWTTTNILELEVALKMKLKLWNQRSFELLSLGLNYKSIESIDSIKTNKPDLKDSNVPEYIKTAFKLSPELSTIGSPEQYLKYINSIFPDSKVKDILYHVTFNKFNKFERGHKNIRGESTNTQGFHFINRKGLPHYLSSDEVLGEKFYKYGDKLLQVVVNFKNPKIAKYSSVFEYLSKDSLEKFQREGYDSISMEVDDDTYENIAFDQEQIHIIGEDFEGFKNFVKNDNTSILSNNYDFNLLFGNDDFINKLNLNNFNRDYLDQISDYNHKPAEIIMPKLYRSEFEIGNDTHSKIYSLKAEYFKDQLNQILNPETFDCDLFISSKTDSMYISALTEGELGMKIKSGELEKTSINIKEINGAKWRVDIKGNKLYELPTGVRIYESNGVEQVIVIKDQNNKFLKTIREFIKKTKPQFVYPFSNINPDLIDSYIELSNKFNNSTISNLLKVGVVPLDKFDEIKQKAVETLSQAMFTSWEKSNDVVAARIPSQAMQSFQSMKVVGYNEDPGNNVWVSHIQLWLQGSDFDIDKAYIMTHGFKHAIYEGWSPYFDYTSYQNLKLSENLPVPSKKQYVWSNEGVDLSGDLIVLDNLKSKEVPLDFIITLLSKVRGSDSIIKLEHPRINELLEIINNHNNYEYSTASLKNYVVRNIIETSNHPKNQISSHSPITFGEYEDIKKSKDNSFVLSLMDGISMYQQQETNAIGKDVIGIAANGIKDYFALVEYFSKYYSGEIKKTDNEYFERTFTLNGETPVKVNRIAGLSLEKQASDMLNKYIGREVSTALNLNPNTDPALVLSSLLSASTDNAKELILKAINAGKEFASMHIYLIMVGFSEGAVAKFMTSPEISSIQQKFKSNIFVRGNDKKSPDSIVNEILDNEKTPIQLREFKKIYNLSKELTYLAKILKINQGLKASSENIYTYFKDIENEFINRENQFVSDNFNKVSRSLKLPSDVNKFNYLEQMILNDKMYLLPHQAQVVRVINLANEAGVSKGNFSFEKYFSDETYKKIAIDYYNLIKGTYNVLDVIEKLPHFKGMVQATKMSYDQINNMSKKFNFVTETIQEILSKSKIDTVIYKVKGSNRISLKDSQIVKAYETFEDLLISKWFKTNFKNDLEHLIDLNQLRTLTNSEISYFDENGKLNQFKEGDNVVIDFTQDVMLANFKAVMENNILPYLKREYSDNQFITGLMLRKATGQKDRTWISTKVRMNKLTDPKNLELLFNYQQGFNQLSDDNITIKIGENSFKVADLFFLYNLIVNKDKSGSDRLTKLFGTYVSNPNSVSRKYYEFYSKIDSGEELLFDEDFPLDDSMRKIIEYGVLNTKGKLFIGKGQEKIAVELPNPNFTLITTLTRKAPEYDNRIVLNEILKYINNKNLLIQFNCE